MNKILSRARNDKFLITRRSGCVINFKRNNKNKKEMFYVCKTSAEEEIVAAYKACQSRAQKLTKRLKLTSSS